MTFLYVAGGSFCSCATPHRLNQERRNNGMQRTALRAAAHAERDSVGASQAGAPWRGFLTGGSDMEGAICRIVIPVNSRSFPGSAI